MRIILTLGQTPWVNNRGWQKETHRWRNTREMAWCTKSVPSPCVCTSFKWIYKCISDWFDSKEMLLGHLYWVIMVAYALKHVCVFMCVYAYVSLHLEYHELPGKWPLITFIFSCNLKAITISLGVRKSVNMEHLFDGQGRVDKSSASASISNCY